MKSALVWSLATVAALAAAPSGYSWWDVGHKAMAIEATALLKPAARAHVKSILGTDDLASAATWMDELKEARYHAGPLATDPEALHFNHVFPHNSDWHFVDLPLGLPAYDPNSGFSRPDDLVHMLSASIDVLEGHGDPNITKPEALWMLVHFCGDIHQPLHVANGFFRVSDSGVPTLVTDPAEAEGLSNDKGGNCERFGKAKSDVLHAYWDGILVEKFSGGKDPVKVATLLSADAAQSGASWADAGDYHLWPGLWATESILAARTAYAGLSYGNVELDPRGGIRTIWVTLPTDYDRTALPLARERLAKSGYRLAELLNAIHWAD
jgi:hypothetical protein